MGRGADRLKEWIFPDICVVCNKALTRRSEITWLCPDCAQALPWRSEEERVLPLLSGRFFGRLPASERRLAARLACVCACRYEEELPRLIRLLKFNERIDMARPLGEVLASALKTACMPGALGGAVVTPVPLSSRRWRERGYNQAEEIAAIVAKKLGLAFCPNLLVKSRETARQSECDDLERLSQGYGAYQVMEPSAWHPDGGNKDAVRKRNGDAEERYGAAPRQVVAPWQGVEGEATGKAVKKMTFRPTNIDEEFDNEEAAGEKIILVDDLLTSGATLFHAASALYQAGMALPLCATAASSRKMEVQAAPRPGYAARIHYTKSKGDESPGFERCFVRRSTGLDGGCCAIPSNNRALN